MKKNNRPKTNLQNFLNEPDSEQQKQLCEVYKQRALIHCLSRVINESNACEYTLSQIRSARRKLQDISHSLHGKGMILRRASSNQEVSFISNCIFVKGDHTDPL